MTNKEKQEQIALLQMTYDKYGKLIKLAENVYGFVSSHNKVRLVNIENGKMIHGEWNLRYIGENVIILNSYMDQRLMTGGCGSILLRGLIVEIGTLDIIYESENDLLIADDIIYETLKDGFPSDEELPFKIFDMRGNLLGNLITTGDIVISKTDNDEYYIVEERYNARYDYKYTLLHYDKKNNTMKSVWYTDEHDIQCIGYGLYKISKNKNYKETMIYDIVNMKYIN